MRRWSPINDQSHINRILALSKKTRIVICAAMALGIILIVVLALFHKSTSTALYIYMCGSNLESSQGIASRNITELLQAEVPPNMTIIIQTGGASKWKTHNIPSNKIARYQVKNHELVELETLDQANMGDESTFSDFLSFASKNYSAHHKMLIVWDHGAGTLQGACFDENFYNDKLTLPEMKNGLESGLAGEKLFAVGFDACLMADIEVGRVIAPSSNMLIASQATETGEGWDYKRLINDLSHLDDPSAFGKSVCDAYYEKSSRMGNEAPVTLSAIDLRSFDKVNEAFDDFGRAIDKEINEVDLRTALIHCMQTSGSYGIDKSGKGGNLYDLLSFVSSMKDHTVGDVSTCASNLEDELKKAILYSKAGSARQDSSGLSMYYPLRYSSTEVSDYLSINQSDPWSTIVSKMYTHVPEETIGFENNGSIEDGVFSVTLSPSSAQYLRETRYVLMQESDERPVPVPIRFDILNDLDSNNLRISPVFPTTMFTFNNVPVPVTLIDMSSNTETYTILFMLNNRMKSFMFARVNEGDAWRCYPIGIMEFDESINAPSKDYVQLKEGDKVHVNGKDIEIGSEGVVINEVPLKEGRYTYQILCVDIFGKQISSSEVNMEYRGGEWKALSFNR